MSDSAPVRRQVNKKHRDENSSSNNPQSCQINKLINSFIPDDWFPDDTDDDDNNDVDAGTDDTVEDVIWFLFV